jgi:hypothetical protein
MILSPLRSLRVRNSYYYDRNTILRLVSDVKLLDGALVQGTDQSRVLRRETCLIRSKSESLWLQFWQAAS